MLAAIEDGGVSQEEDLQPVTADMIQAMLDEIDSDGEASAAPSSVPAAEGHEALLVSEPGISGSSSSNSSSSSASSSSSSSSSSDEHAGHAAPALEMNAAAQPHAKAKAKAVARVAPKAKSAAARAGHPGSGGLLLESTSFWRECKLTRLKDKDQQISGYEITCRHPQHVRCRRSLKFSAHGGERNVLLKLKWWCLQARYYANQKEHVGSCPRVWPGEPPTEAELDALAFGF